MNRFMCRAKSRVGYWLYGGFDGGHIVTCDGMAYDIEKGTEGQCTGLKDKYGTLIYEGDILSTLWGDKCAGVVKYSDTYGMYEFVCKSRKFKYDFTSTQSDEYEIIGNSTDNPELLEA